MKSRTIRKEKDERKKTELTYKLILIVFAILLLLIIIMKQVNRNTITRHIKQTDTNRQYKFQIEYKFSTECNKTATRT